MRSNTCGANCQRPTDPKINRWFYPPDRPWIEFVLIACLSMGSLLSIASLLISAHEAKQARVVATSRLEVIYHDLMKSEEEIKQLKVLALSEEREFHRTLKESMQARSKLLKRIAVSINIPAAEVDEILMRDPNY